VKVETYSCFHNDRQEESVQALVAAYDSSEKEESVSSKPTFDGRRVYTDGSTTTGPGCCLRQQ